MDVNADRRNFSLDVLRGAAILLVLVRHVPGGASAGFPRAPYELGWTGVELFFTLSGFLISNILYGELDRTGTLDVKRFLLRRGMKIWPSYFACFGLMTAGVVAANVSAGDATAALKTFLAAAPNVVFLQNYLGYQWPHSWSLAIEEHFYCVLPLVLLSLSRRGAMRRLPALLFCVCAVVLALRVGMYLTGWVRWQSYYYPTHLRIDSLAWGVLLGYAYRYHGRRFHSAARRWPVLLAVSLPLLGVAILFPLGTSAFAVTVGFTCLYLAYGILVLIAGAYPGAGRRFPPARALAWCGVYSYTIYLAHSAISVIPAFGPEYGGNNIWAARLAFWALSIGLGVMLSHLVERPFLRYRQRVLPSPQSTQPAPLPRGVAVT